jgi:hypothetical protein
MLFLDGGLVLFALWVVCVIDVIVADELRVRNLPKMVWLLIVLLLPDVGSIAWLVAGRDWQSGTKPATSRTATTFPEYDRPGRHIAANPDDDEAFLRQVRQRAEEQRQRAKRQRPAGEAAEKDLD